MRNRAKCSNCLEIIESLHTTDFVPCKCGDIAVDGGPDNFKCFAKDWAAFVRVDDEGKEIVPTIKDKNDEMVQEDKPRSTKSDVLFAVKNMRESYDTLPQHALSSFASNADILSLLLLLQASLEADCNEEI